MSFIALLTWITAAALGLYLLSIWLIEYDKEFQSAAATRLPPAVLTGHVLAAGGGLLIWAAYLIFDDDNLAWFSLLALGIAATLGLTMAIRWLSVYRAKRQGELAAAISHSSAAMPDYGNVVVRDIGPPERNFPLPVVVAHGAFAFATIGLVLLTTLGVGGS